MSAKSNLILLIITVLLSFYSCKNKAIVYVATQEIAYIGAHSATGGGLITGENTIEKGVCWSTSPNPTINNQKTVDGSGVDSYSSTITNLNPLTEYYVRAYATTTEGTSYGDNRTFYTTAYSNVATLTTQLRSVSRTGMKCITQFSVPRDAHVSFWIVLEY